MRSSFWWRCQALQGALVRRAGVGRRAGADHVDVVCAAEAMGEPTRLMIAS